MSPHALGIHSVSSSAPALAAQLDALTRAMPEQNPAIQLDSEEQELLSDSDAGAWRSVATPGVLQSLREAARATGQKEQLVIQEQPAIQAAR